MNEMTERARRIEHDVKQAIDTLMSNAGSEMMLEASTEELLFIQSIVQLCNDSASLLVEQATAIRELEEKVDRLTKARLEERVAAKLAEARESR